MKFRAKRRDRPSIEMTPLIDVTFQLLLFFMLSTTLRNSPSFDVNLPEASTDKLLQEDHSLIIVITKEDDIVIDDAVVKEDSLADILQQKLQENSNLVLVIEADEEVQHKKVVSLMDLASEIGIQQLQIGTKQKK